MKLKYAFMQVVIAAILITIGAVNVILLIAGDYLLLVKALQEGRGDQWKGFTVLNRYRQTGGW